MDEVLRELLKQYHKDQISKLDIIPWAMPIPFFGNITNSIVATLGLNPSNKEFIDNTGNELIGQTRRFETLDSLNIEDWNNVDDVNLHIIIDSCNKYFMRNSYDKWFKKLDFLISGSGYSYYFPYSNACHLDLIPFATEIKWGDINLRKKKYLQEISKDFLGMILKHSPIKVLILNGQAVVEGLLKISDATLEKKMLSQLNLKRISEKSISGYGFIGEINKIGEICLDKPIKIIGFNHNIQSSFGITKNVQLAIRDWIQCELKYIL
jgi:hypothetical protein